MGRFDILKIKDWISKKQFIVLGRWPASGDIAQIKRKKDGQVFLTQDYSSGEYYVIKILSFSEDLVHCTIQLVTVKRQSWDTAHEMEIPSYHNPIDCEVNQLALNSKGHLKVYF